MTDHWANDKVIAIWMFQLREIYSAMCEDYHRPKTLFIDPIVGLHELIAKTNWFKINRLYKDMRLKAKLSLVDYDCIVIPVNENLHWTFQTIYLNKRTVVDFNSFNRSQR
jgi:Ulp1 family protease